MKMSRECISHYSTFRRFGVFSHDILVCKMELKFEDSYTAFYLDVAGIVVRKKIRQSLLQWVINYLICFFFFIKILILSNFCLNQI